MVVVSEGFKSCVAREKPTLEKTFKTITAVQKNVVSEVRQHMPRAGIVCGDLLSWTTGFAKAFTVAEPKRRSMIFLGVTSNESNFDI